MRRRLLGLSLLWLFVGIAGSAAHAVTIDDFSAGFPSPSGVLTGPTGFGSLSQSPLSGVLGGARVTGVVADVPTSPTGVTILANPNPPPLTNVANLVIGGGGGLLELDYPNLGAYDLTLGGGGPAPSSVIAVRSTLMVADAMLRLTLTDVSGVSASTSLSTVDFAGTGDHSYLFPVDATTFAAPGLELDKVDRLRVELSAGTGQDAELSDVSLLAVSPKTTSWDQAFALQVTGGLEIPAFLVSFNPQPEPPHTPDITLDTTDPKQPRIVITGHPPDPILEFRFAPYGGVSSLRSTVVDGNHFEFGFDDGGTVYRVEVDVSSSSGLVIDPAGFVGFNPQPEPPNPASIVGFNPQPEPPLPGHAVGFEFPMKSLGAAASAAGPDTITLTMQILDDADNPVELAYVGSVDVPGLNRWGLVWLALALVGVVLLIPLRRWA